HLDRIAPVMGNDEHVVVVRRVVAPPTLPLLIPPVPPGNGPEHFSAPHAGPAFLAPFLCYPCALVHLAALLAGGFAPGGERDDPVMEPLAALAKRVHLRLVRAGDEGVQRARGTTPNL